jgi:uncharacterized protein
VNIFSNVERRPVASQPDSAWSVAERSEELRKQGSKEKAATDLSDSTRTTSSGAEAEFSTGLTVEAEALTPGAKHSSAEHSWGVRVALFALSFYKSYLSILMAGNCRFQPTCSRYAYEAIEHFGAARGTWLAVKRLCRCHPLSRKFGYDPVPEKDEQMPAKSAGCENCGAPS